MISWIKDPTEWWTHGSFAVHDGKIVGAVEPNIGSKDWEVDFGRYHKETHFAKEQEARDAFVKWFYRQLMNEALR